MFDESVMVSDFNYPFIILIYIDLIKIKYIS